MVNRMQQVMRLFAAGLAKEFLVERLNIRIFMGHAEHLAGIFAVQPFHTLLQQVTATMQERLTAAVDTAARASHDFDRLEAVGICPDHIQHLAGIPQTGTRTFADFTVL